MRSLEKIPRIPTTVLAAVLPSLLAAACGAGPAFEPPNVSEQRSDLYVDGDHLWPKAAGQAVHIPVCFEPASPGSAQARAWTRDAVENTWGRFADVFFTGWGVCLSGQVGVHVIWADQQPLTHDLGTGLNGEKGGMVLNETFINWSSGDDFASCINDRENCIRWIAVHEFGHALGFSHEQNRPDAPNCGQPQQGDNGTYTIGPYDLASVMNYCNPNWNNHGRLSAGDIRGVQTVYGRKPSGSIVGPNGRCFDASSTTTHAPVTLHDCVHDWNETFSYHPFAGTTGFVVRSDVAAALQIAPHSDGTWQLEVDPLGADPVAQQFSFDWTAIQGFGGRCLQVDSYALGAGAHLADCDGSLGQQFYLSGGHIQTAYGYCLESPSETIGAGLQANTCNSSPGQALTLSPGGNISTGWGSGRCIGVNTGNGLVLSEYCSAGLDRVWNLSGKIDSGYGGFCLNPYSGLPGAPVYLAQYNDQIDQFQYYP